MTKKMSIKKASIIYATGKYLSVFIQIGFTVVLARLLTPQEYGVVAIIIVIITFFTIFADMGVGTAIIQNKSLLKNDIDNIFSFSVYLGIGLMFIFILMAYPISIFYNNSIYIPLSLILSISLLFSTINTVPNAIMMKDKKFISVSIRTVVVNIVTSLIAVLLVLLKWGIYALVMQSVVSALLIYIWNRFAVRVRFKYKPEVESIKKIWEYSIFQFWATVLNYVQRTLDSLLLGKVLGAEKLGYYNKAYSLSRLPINYLPQAITPIIHPILSEHQNDLDYIYNQYMKIIHFLSLLGCFGMVFCWFAAKEIILIMYGSQWDVAVIPFQTLSLCLWTQIIVSTVGAIYQSIGKTKLMFYTMLIVVLISVSGIVIGILFNSINAMSICVTITSNINFFIYFFSLVAKGMEKSFLKFMLSFKFDLLISVVLFAFTLFYPFNFKSLVLTFFIKFIYLGVIYLVMLRVTSQDTFIIKLVNPKKNNITNKKVN